MNWIGLILCCHCFWVWVMSVYIKLMCNVSVIKSVFCVCVCVCVYVCVCVCVYVCVCVCVCYCLFIFVLLAFKVAFGKKHNKIYTNYHITHTAARREGETISHSKGYTEKPIPSFCLSCVTSPMGWDELEGGNNFWRIISYFICW